MAKSFRQMTPVSGVLHIRKQVNAMGGVVHFEIPADDEDRARKFYESVFGFWIPALVMPQLFLGAAAAVFILARGRSPQSSVVHSWWGRGISGGFLRCR